MLQYASLLYIYIFIFSLHELPVTTLNSLIFHDPLTPAFVHSTGGMLAICDINAYRKCVQRFKVL